MAALDPKPPLWARPPVLAVIVLAIAAAKLWVSAGTGLVLDEAYYTLWSFHLSPGYLDHPPAIAWLIAAGRAIAGDSELGVRLLPVACGIVAAAALWRIGRLLFDAKVAALAVIWHTTSVAAALGFVATPDAPSVLCWTLTLWALAEFCASRNPAWWLAVGLFAGLGLAGKLTNAFLGVGILLFLLSSAERRAWLRIWQLWAGGLVALIVFSPVLWWNAAHGWATFAFQGQRVLGGVYMTGGLLTNFGDLIGGQALAAGLIPLVAATAAIVVALRGEFRHQGPALAVITSLPLLLFFVVQAISWKVEANWLVPIWPVLSLAAASIIVRWAGLAGSLVRLAQPVVNLVLVALIFAQALFQPFDAAAIDRTREMRGWAQFQRDVSVLAAANGAKWVGSAGGYGLNAELFTYGRFADDSLPVHQLDQRERYAFHPSLDAAALGAPMLYVEQLWDPIATPVAPLTLQNPQLLQILERRHGDEVLNRYAVWLADGPGS